ncbi:hypothetical protein TCSYLVIO_000269, partial [Trypanosoma cruzi]
VCPRCVQRGGCGAQRGAHSTAAEESEAKHNHYFSYLVHRATTHAHKSPRLSAGTHSPHTPLQPTAVYASADAASTSGAHTHAELLRLPSISRRRDGAWVVDTAGTSVVVLLGACVVVVVVVVGAFVVVVVVVVVGGFVVVVVVVVWEVAAASSSAHTDGLQQKASTNRAHSRRHVIIIVSVVVQWCGADLHSEGNGEQQERREVQQTHTEGTPHEERA